MPKWHSPCRQFQGNFTAQKWSKMVFVIFYSQMQNSQMNSTLGHVVNQNLDKASHTRERRVDIRRSISDENQLGKKNQ